MEDIAWLNGMNAFLDKQKLKNGRYIYVFPLSGLICM
jgi:hypothetical protein